MAKPAVSIQSTLRRTVRAAYRSRGKGNTNLWLVYSAKTNSDWIVLGDRRLIYWIYFLEADPSVRTFDLAPEQSAFGDEHDTRATEFAAVVTPRIGPKEWHVVKSGRGKKDSAQSLEDARRVRVAAAKQAVYRRINDTEIANNAKVAVRWIKAMGFAAAIAGYEYAACRTSMILAMKKRGHGTVRELLGDLAECDVAIVHGMLVRLAIAGVARIDLHASTYGLQTRWTYHGDFAQI